MSVTFMLQPNKTFTFELFWLRLSRLAPARWLIRWKTAWDKKPLAVLCPCHRSGSLAIEVLLSSFSETPDWQTSRIFSLPIGSQGIGQSAPSDPCSQSFKRIQSWSMRRFCWYGMWQYDMFETSGLLWVSDPRHSWPMARPRAFFQNERILWCAVTSYHMLDHSSA